MSTGVYVLLLLEYSARFMYKIRSFKLHQTIRRYGLSMNIVEGVERLFKEKTLKDVDVS